MSTKSRITPETTTPKVDLVDRAREEAAALAPATLRQRFGALKTYLPRLTSRPEPETSESRRALMVGAAASAFAMPLPAVAVAAAPAALPIAASIAAALPLPHPDQAVFEAEVAHREAKEAFEAARDASAAATKAISKALGPCPVALYATEWEARFILDAPAPRIRGFGRVGSRSFWQGASGDEGPGRQQTAWTARGLQTVIERAVTALGQGGTTPRHLRRWKTLLPIAEAYDTREAELRVLHRTVELDRQVDEAEKARSAALSRLSAAVATTPEGLAAKVRWVDSTQWHDMPTHWVTLLQSAAAVAGVTLTPSEFDCEGWVRDFEAAGGTIERTGTTRWWMFSIPPDGRQQPTSEPTEGLLRKADGHGHEIRRWLDATRGA